MDYNDFDDYMMYEMANSDDEFSGGGGGGSGRGGGGCGGVIIGGLIVIGILAILGSITSSCDAAGKKKNTYSSYKATSSYSSSSKNTSYSSSSKTTTDAYRPPYPAASPPVEGAYITDALRAQSSWQGTDKIFGERTTKYNYRKENSSYTFWVNSSGKILKVSEARYGKPSTGSNTTKKKKQGSESTTKKSQDYDTDDFMHVDDFYDWYKDDFVDLEDAEDYWDEFGE